MDKNKVETISADEIIFGFGYYPSKKNTQEGFLLVKAMNEFANLKLKELNDKNNTKVDLGETKTPLECWRKAGLNPDNYSRAVREAMDEYADSVNEFTHNLFNNPCVELKPLEDLWRKEHPSDGDVYVIPDRTKFYEWIRIKILGV